VVLPRGVPEPAPSLQDCAFAADASDGSQLLAVASDAGRSFVRISDEDALQAAREAVQVHRSRGSVQVRSQGRSSCK